jgi:hypothetical protein
MFFAMRYGFAALLALSGCYAPVVVGGAPCDVARDNCPTGQTCVASGASSGVCSGGTTVDAGKIGDVGEACLGKQLLGSVCLQVAPTAAVTLSSATIDTASTTAGNCTEIRAQAGGPSLCIVAGTSISVPAGITVRAIGSNALVLVASGTITVAGSVEVSSRAGETIGGLPALGAGARASCAVLGLDGEIGRFQNNSDYGGGGGGGGSFGSLGGAGGKGGRGTIAGGTVVGGAVPRVLVGGCPGGRGGDGEGGGGGGAGGSAGGAVYLLAGDTISVLAGGKLGASGAGGAAGTDGMFSSGAGGGGGAGGMIGLEAASLRIAGSLVANGGGGGGGCGGAPTDHGLPGADASVATIAATGGNGGGGGGGNGGAGSIGTTAGAAAAGGTTNDVSAGGGGGGGAGVIRLFGTPTTTGTISPPAS